MTLPNITRESITTAIEKLSLNKACSWDLISDQLIIEYRRERNISNKNKFIDFVFGFIQELLKIKRMPEFMSNSRLVFLNKNPTQVATLDTVRPIIINSIFFKIIEKVALEVLENFVYENNILNKEQIGFIKNCGTSLNIKGLVSK